MNDGKELQRKFCIICGEVMGERIVEAHKDHAEILEEPTCAKEGKKVKYCKVCGEICEESSIEKLGHKPDSQ